MKVKATFVKKGFNPFHPNIHMHIAGLKENSIQKLLMFLMILIWMN
jgi:hypothetical protein